VVCFVETDLGYSLSSLKHPSDFKLIIVVAIIDDFIAIIEFVIIEFDAIIDELAEIICEQYLNYLLGHHLIFHIGARGFFSRLTHHEVVHIREGRHLILLVFIQCVAAG
jgi:hypothetical protein